MFAAKRAGKYVVSQMLRAGSGGRRQIWLDRVITILSGR
jgi:hypothetical protein